MPLDDQPPLKPGFDKSASPDQPAKRLMPSSLRFSAEDRRGLEHDAAGMSLASYIRWRGFYPTTPK